MIDPNAPMESSYVVAGTRPDARSEVADDPLAVTFAQLIARQSEVFGGRELVVDGSTRMTYAEFNSHVIDCARSLMAIGVEPGDRVAVWAPNCLDWLVAAIGTSATGAVLLPMNSRFKGAESADVIRRTKPRVLFTVGGFLDNDYPAMLRAAASEGDLDGLRIVVLDAGTGSTGEDGDLSLDEFLALGRQVSVDAAVQRRDAVSAHTVSDLMLTSGTSGRPKAVMTTHHQNVLGYTRLAQHIRLRSGERINATLPFFHNFGYKAGFLVSAMVGGTCVIESVFDPVRLVRLIEEERISVLMGTPTLFTSLLSSEERHAAELSSLRLSFVGGAMVARELLERLRAELTPQVVTGYGLSELAGAVSLTPPEFEPDRIDWSGQLIEGVRVRIVDEFGEDVPRGRPGEILAHGECVMRGYLDDPRSAAEAVDHDGWLHTGDIGILDKEGYLRITDRKKDMFIVGGFNAYPAEIERLLLLHPAIAQVAVVGMADERLNEVAAAFVVPAPGTDLQPETVIQWARENMANYKVPRRVELVDQLPTNASMKVLKHELRARLAST